MMKKSAAPPGAAALPRNPRPLLRAALIVAAYLCAFSILDLLSLQFEELRGIVAWYPPAGLTYTLLLVFGVRFGPAVTIALLISSLFIYRMPQPPYLLFLWALIISLIYSSAAAFLRHRIRLDWQLRKARDVTWLVITTVLVSAVLAVLSVLSSALSSDMPRSEVLAAIFHWWIGETVGVLTITPFLLIHVMPGLKRFAHGQPVRWFARRSFPRPTLAAIGQAFSLALTLYWVFGVRVLDEFHPLFLITLPLIWIALDRGFKGVTAGIVALNFGVILALWFAHLDLGHLGELQLLMIVNCIVGLLMGAVVTERKRAEQENANLAKYPTENPNPVLRLSRDGIVLDANAASGALLDMWGCAVGDSVPQFWRDLVAQALASRESKTVDIECDGKVYSMFVTPVAEPGYVNLYGGDITERKRAEEALMESSAQFRTLFEASPDAIVLIDPHDHWPILDCNTAACQMNGYTHDELVGQSIDVLNLTPGDPTERAGYVERIRQSSILRLEALHHRKDGTVFPVEVSTSMIALGGREVVLGIDRDITERKRVEEVLRESEERYQTLARISPVGIFRTDSDGSTTYVNPKWRAISGLSVEEALGDGWLDAVHPDDRENLSRGWQASAQSQKASFAEYRLVRPDGAVAWVMGQAVPEVNIEGQTVGYVGTITDITERKHAEAEREQLLRQIQAQAHQLAQVMRTVPEGVLLLDAAGRVVLANPRAEEDLPILAGAQVGDPLSHLGDRPLAELLNAPPSGQWHDARADDHIFEIIARPIAIGPSPDNWVLVLRDVTEEREARQRALQGERLAAVGQLAAGVAHDFNNILAVIALDARLALAAPDLPDGVRARLATISGQTQRAADLVRQILDFSRQAVLERRPVALRPFLAEQIAVLARILPESIALELAGTEDACMISADPTRLQQIVMNLAVNARDAMPAGGRLRFTLARVPALPFDLQPQSVAPDEGSGWVRLTVADSGLGIPPEVLPHIFEPFFTTKGPGKGSGLGLAQIHGIVKQHGGEISVSTQVGVGTTFTLHLPALTEFTVAQPVVVADEAPAAAGQTILIVEDDSALRNALVDTVDLLGYRTLSAANGREALAVLAQHSEIVLIMSDLGMPVMGGRELLQEVKQRGMTTPLVILSGHPLDDELASLQALGLAGWLLKPPQVEQLARLLAQTLPA